MSKKSKSTTQPEKKGGCLSILGALGGVAVLLAAVVTVVGNNPAIVNREPVVPAPTRIPFDGSFHPVPDLDPTVTADFNVSIVGERQDWPNYGQPAFPPSPDNWMLYVFHNIMLVNLDGENEINDKVLGCNVVVVAPGDNTRVWPGLDPDLTALSGRAWELVGIQGNIMEFALTIRNSMRNDPQCFLVGIVGRGVEQYDPGFPP